ncbi:MAG: TadE family protein [Acidimicrobiia bacterium]
MTELTLLAPLLIVMMLFVALAGRLMSTENALVGTTRDAARAATLRERADDARAAAEMIVAEGTGSTCRDRQTEVEVPVTADGRVVPGSVVRVHVRCRVNLADMALLRMPGSKVIDSRSSEVVDRFRGVQ